MIKEIYTYLTNKNYCCNIINSDIPSGYINIELLGELPTEAIHMLQDYICDVYWETMPKVEKMNALFCSICDGGSSHEFLKTFLNSSSKSNLKLLVEKKELWRETRSKLWKFQKYVLH